MIKKAKNTVLIFLGVLLMFAASCSGCGGATKVIKKQQHDHVSAQNLAEKCSEPEEFYTVPPFRFPIPAQVMRHKNCMNVPDLLVVIWPGDASEKNLTAARLLMLMYVEYQSSDGFEIEGSLLKTDKTSSDGINLSMSFYELKKVVKELPNENN